MHFESPRLSDALANAARYLRAVEEASDCAPHVLCVNDALAFGDDVDPLWRVTLVVGCPGEGGDV
ncbi:hypothetical protein [Frankia sp. AgB32]|uniref:hypothetical protein n=1 Tax=Frankia sp. AgB32 TaxID=631119 RepID=UPI00200E4C46|nr:hypothetical protein [Frankia sp. AgB32]MCK9897088.1 hypothetical protein [Frankia sp. AgB32]